ncbi:hypothetical protein MMC25_003482 [Agyrium rufum]|nr:hypothetical protein [Agyrium rufum]
MPYFYNIPSARRQSVSFDASPLYSRPARDDEAHVMKSFARHASKCSECADPYETYMSGQSLCAQGHKRAIAVAEYVYNRSGKPYSVVDRERNQTVQIEIPAGCEPVRSLLRAMERGLRLGSRTTSESLDRTYFVQERIPSSTAPPKQSTLLPTTLTSVAHTPSTRTSRSRPQYETIERVPRVYPAGSLSSSASSSLSPRRHRRQPSALGKGSLYEADMAEVQYKEPVYYRITPSLRESKYYD